MKQVLCLFMFLFCQVLFANGYTVHWFEAEDFKGNSNIVGSNSASGGAFVEGKTWYHFVMGIPFPQDGKTYNVWTRVQSDVPANWYLYENSEKKRAFGWFHTDKPDEWTWVLIGKFSNSIGETFYSIYLQKPIDKNIPTATGRMDVVVITDIDNADVLENLLKQRIEKKNEKLSESTKENEKEKFLLSSRRLSDVPYIKIPPIIDGVLNDEAWQKAAKLGDFTLTNGKLATEQTIGYIAYDDNNLYIAAEMLESQIPFIRKVRTKRNDNVWQDDCLEIFIDPGFTQKEALHFIVNPIGTRQDNLSVRIDRVTAIGEEGLDWKVATTIGKDKWFVEASIPFRLLDVNKPGEGEIWGFNLNREQRPKGELSHWNYVGGDFNQPDKFGLISFGQKPVTLEAVTFGELFKDITFSLKAIDGDTKNLSIFLTIAKGEDVFIKSNKEISITGNKTKKITFPLSIEKPGFYNLSAVIKDSEKVLYELKFPIKTYSESLVSVAWPPEMRGGNLYIALNTAQHCFFLFANHFPDKRQITNPIFVVSVPSGVKILDPMGSLLIGPERYNNVTSWNISEESKNGQIYHKYTFNLEKNIPPSRIEKVRFFQNSLVLFFTIENGVFSAGEKIPAYFKLEADGIEEEENMMYLVTLPNIEGKQPKNILIHNWLWTFNTCPSIWKPYLDTLQKAGFNSISVETDKSYYSDMAKEQYHMIIINNFWWFWWNNEYLKEHPEHTAITFNGVRDSSPLPRICPTILLENNGEVLRESIKGFSQSVTNGITDGYIWDLEGPGAWDVCFCKRCLDEFRKFAKISQEEELTPRGIKEKYANEWILFATHQSSMLSEVIRNELKKNNPNATWGVYSGMPGQMTMESYRCNWEEIANYIDIAYPTGYSNSPSFLDDRFVSGWKEFIKLMEGTPPRNHRVKTVPTLTPGYERGAALQPSADLIRMQILRSVASGADGVSFWWWGPMDGLYYQEIGRATALIAKFEDFFLKGKNNNSIIKIEKNPYGKNVSWEVFTLGNKHLVILFNHSANETRKLSFSFPGMDTEISGYFYPDGKKFNPLRETTVEIKPLEIAVLILQ